jgi:hypothetical protein
VDRSATITAGMARSGAPCSTAYPPISSGCRDCTVMPMAAGFGWGAPGDFADLMVEKLSCNSADRRDASCDANRSANSPRRRAVPWVPVATR